MDRNLELYLDTFDKHLKSMPASERIDIIKEIKSSTIEMEKSEGLTPQQIIDKLGNPKDLAQAYLGESISKNPGFNWQKWKTVIAFYGATGFSGMFVIPVLGILSPVLKLCGYFVPLAGLVKLIGFYLGYDLPIAIVQIGSFELHPALALVVAVIFGVLFHSLGRYLWKLLLEYIQKVSEKKRNLFVN